jgi:glycogen synthase kinase 3 beta
VCVAKKMRELNNFIDDEFREAGDAIGESSSDFLSINNESKCADSGIICDENCSKFSISSHESTNLAKVESVTKISSKQSLSKSSIKSTSVSTMAVPRANKIRSKRYSLPDIDKLKQYSDVKVAKTRKTTQCDNESETQAAIPLVPTEMKLDNFFIDPKLINKFDGLSQSLYYIDENGSPKIRERYIKQQRMLIEKQEMKRREKEARRRSESEGSCSCFNFGRLGKKLKELCK